MSFIYESCYWRFKTQTISSNNSRRSIKEALIFIIIIRFGNRIIQDLYWFGLIWTNYQTDLALSRTEPETGLPPWKRAAGKCGGHEWASRIRLGRLDLERKRIRGWVGVAGRSARGFRCSRPPTWSHYPPNNAWLPAAGRRTRTCQKRRNSLSPSIPDRKFQLRTLNSVKCLLQHILLASASHKTHHPPNIHRSGGGGHSIS